VELKGLRPFIRYVCADQPCDEDRAARIHIPDGVRVAVLVRDGGRCRRCRRCRSATNLEVDHPIPVSKGGGSDESNLQTLCRRCNRRKWKKDAAIGLRPRIFSFLPLGATRFPPAIPRRRPGAKGATRGGQGDRVDIVIEENFDPYLLQFVMKNVVDRAERLPHLASECFGPHPPQHGRSLPSRAGGKSQRAGVPDIRAIGPKRLSRAQGLSISISQGAIATGSIALGLSSSSVRGSNMIHMAVRESDP
jgi:5-methylcytosine-specific restriction endonuclease McrA